MKTKAHVVVGLSGGVDSAVTACLLKEQGYHVTGAIMKMWDGQYQPKAKVRLACFGPHEEKNIQDVKAIAQHLQIPWHVVDLSDLFKNDILNYCAKQYSAGLTPNPCIYCNRLLKFGALIEKLKSQGLDFDYLATGHYAQVRQDQSSKRFILYKGMSTKKDQSYFLYQLKQNQLAKVLWPLGTFDKSVVRQMARERNLPVSEKSESQDFIAGGYQEIIKEQPPPGPIYLYTGQQVGTHQGIHRHTIGQRRGLGIAYSEPLYVIRIDPKAHALWVGPYSHLLKNKFRVEEINWIAIEKLSKPKSVMIKIRYNSAATPGKIVPLNNDQIEVHLDSPQQSITPGQAAVFYEAKKVLGGGIIVLE